MSLRILIVLLLVCGGLSTSAQTLLRFHPTYYAHSIALDQEVDSLERPTRFRCYIRDIAFLKKEQVVWQEADSYHLIDAEDLSTLSKTLDAPNELNYDAISFWVGIDSVTAVSGAFGGDLDPSKGMYWTWQSGYIDFKLEGFHPKSGSKDKSYTYHLGGYMPPYATTQEVILDISGGDAHDIEIHLDEFIEAIDLESNFHIMSSGESAHQHSLTLPNIFRIR